MFFERPAVDAASRAAGASVRYGWLTPDRQTQVRGVLLGLTLFFGLTVWIWHSLGTEAPNSGVFVRKLRIVGIMTWLYALVQLLDIRFWRSATARKRREAMGIPDSIIAWLFGQMLAWFGIIYYGFTEDARWYLAGLVVLVVTFIVFPVRQSQP